MPRVFVYGTLKRGHPNASLLDGATFVGTANAAGFRLYDLGPHPGVIRSPDGSGFVPGELFDIDAPTLARLDALEAEGTLYARETILVNGHKVFIYVWLGSLDSAVPIEVWTG